MFVVGLSIDWFSSFLVKKEIKTDLNSSSGSWIEILFQLKNVLLISLSSPYVLVEVWQVFY